MDIKGHWRPSFISVALFLKTKSVNDIIKNANRLHLEVGCYCKEGFSRLGILSSLAPLSLVNMLYMIGGGFGT